MQIFSSWYRGALELVEAAGERRKAVRGCEGGRAHLHAAPQPDCGAVPTGGPSRFVPSFLSQSALGFRTKSENGFLSRRLPRLPPSPPPLAPTTTRRISLVYPSPLPRDFQLACSPNTSPQPLLSLIVAPISPFSLSSRSVRRFAVSRSILSREHHGFVQVFNLVASINLQAR